MALGKKAVAGQAAPADRLGNDGFADWVILAVQRLEEYFSNDYRKLTDVIREMPNVRDPSIFHLKRSHVSRRCPPESGRFR